MMADKERQGLFFSILKGASSFIPQVKKSQQRVLNRGEPIRIAFEANHLEITLETVLAGIGLDREIIQEVL